MNRLEELHQHARDRARNRDSKWFARRPRAVIRVREALPYEQILNGDSGATANPFVLVQLTEDRTHVERIYFFADRIPAPDHASLTALRSALDTLARRAPDEGGVILATPEDLRHSKEIAGDVRRLFPQGNRAMGVRL